MSQSCACSLFLAKTNEKDACFRVPQSSSLPQSCTKEKSSGVQIGITIFISWAGSCYTFFLASLNKLLCTSCGMECPSTANFCHQCGQHLNLSQVSNKAASSNDKEKLLKNLKYFHRGYPYAAIVRLLEKYHGVRIHVRMFKTKLKNIPRKLRPVRRCFLSTFTLITCRSFIILNFIYARKASQIQVRKLCKI